MEKGDIVVVTGKLKKVVDFLSTADKETIRILASFFEGEAKGATDAKKFRKPMTVVKLYKDSNTLDVELSKDFVWEEKQEYFSAATEEHLKDYLQNEP